MYKAIIFDCDGMVVQSDRVSERYARDFGVPLQDISVFFNAEFQRCVVGKADLKEELAKYLERWKWDKGIDEFLKYWFDATHNRWDERFEPLILALKKRGLKNYIATNNERYRTDDLLKEKGLEKWFDGVFSSGYIGSKKPDPAFFQHMVTAIKLPKEEIIFWDDDPENIKGAQEFGLPAELYTSLSEFTARINKFL